MVFFFKPPGFYNTAKGAKISGVASQLFPLYSAYCLFHSFSFLKTLRNLTICQLSLLNGKHCFLNNKSFIYIKSFLLILSSSFCYQAFGFANFFANGSFVSMVSQKYDEMKGVLTWPLPKNLVCAIMNKYKVDSEWQIPTKGLSIIQAKTLV